MDTAHHLCSYPQDIELLSKTSPNRSVSSLNHYRQALEFQINPPTYAARVVCPDKKWCPLYAVHVAHPEQGSLWALLPKAH